MYVCMYVCMHVCIFTPINGYLYIYIYTSICVYIYIYIWIDWQRTPRSPQASPTTNLQVATARAPLLCHCTEGPVYPTYDYQSLNDTTRCDRWTSGYEWLQHIYIYIPINLHNYPHMCIYIYIFIFIHTWYYNGIKPNIV